MAIDKIIDRAATISVTSTQVSDDANTSTGALDLPVGTTAERPSSPTSGNIRYNTDIESTEIYDGTAWGKVSPITPIITSVTGTVWTGFSANLTLSGTGFLSANLVVGFTPSGGSETTVTVTPTSDTAATVAVPSAIYNQSGGTSVDVTVTNSDSRTSTAQSITISSLPSGGTILTDGNEKTHIFTASSTNLVIPAGTSISDVEYLVVAGGGGGGGSFRGGGGGAGGLLTSVTGDATATGGSTQSKLTLTAGTWTVNVGAGGTGVNVYYGTEGGHSTIVNPSSTTVVTAIGGGRGGFYTGNNAGGNGGSGGGSAGFSSANGSGGSGTAGQGNDGGTGYSGNIQCGGGGGGAGAAGVNGGNGGTSGDGGNGVISTIISTSEATANSVGEVVGSDVWFAGGGGAGAYVDGNNFPIGGLGGGADGVYGDSPYSNGNDASHPNTGGGGSGSSGDQTASLGTGGDGADGIVIIRYTL